MVYAFIRTFNVRSKHEADLMAGSNKTTGVQAYAISDTRILAPLRPIHSDLEGTRPDPRRYARQCSYACVLHIQHPSQDSEYSPRTRGTWATATDTDGAHAVRTLLADQPPHEPAKEPWRVRLDPLQRHEISPEHREDGMKGGSLGASTRTHALRRACPTHTDRSVWRPPVGAARSCSEARQRPGALDRDPARVKTHSR